LRLFAIENKEGVKFVTLEQDSTGATSDIDPFAR
jgi:hypothetical protein